MAATRDNRLQRATNTAGQLQARYHGKNVPVTVKNTTIDTHAHAVTTRISSGRAATQNDAAA